MWKAFPRADGHARVRVSRSNSSGLLCPFVRKKLRDKYNRGALNDWEPGEFVVPEYGRGGRVLPGTCLQSRAFSTEQTDV